MNKVWTHDKSSALWEPDQSEKEKWPEPFFHGLKLEPIEQNGQTCVPTSLAVVARGTGADVGPEEFKKDSINTQSPHSWSKALAPFKMQLAYCSHDARFLECYIEELIKYDDLFLLCFYSKKELREKPEDGVFGGSHVVTLYRDRIIDTNNDKSCKARDYKRLESRTKRIFRVVPKGHPRCV